MKIVTDRAANFTKQEEEELDLVVAPLYIQFPEGEIETSQISPDDFYQRLIDMKPVIPTTALPSSGFFKELYEKWAAQGEEILSIHLSSGLSGTLESARLGGEQAEQVEVTIFDSQTLSGGQRFQVMAAALAEKAGWSLDQIQERLETIRDQVEVIYALDTLEYLQHGGRIGRVQSLLSSLLNIKPVIHVDHTDGKYSTVGKGRTLIRTLNIMVDHLEELYGQEELWVTVLHGQLFSEAEKLVSDLQDRLQVVRSEIMRVTPVLGVHTGPGIVGAAAVPYALLSDLNS
jgi:DegV family protein with EDD domain